MIDFLYIYELEKIVCALLDKKKKRRVYVDNIYFYDSLEKAEAALQAHIKVIKKEHGTKEYHDGVLEYIICTRRFFNLPVF